MNRQWLVLVVIAGLVLSGPQAVRADLFEEALGAMGSDKLEAARLDNVGRALRGGLAAGYPTLPPGNPLLHDFNISTPCGSFSFGAGLIDNLAGMLDPTALIRGLQNTATNLIGAAISQLPMVSLCYAAPTMCDMVKYLQELVNEILQFKGLSCAQAETLAGGCGRPAERCSHVALYLGAAGGGHDSYPGGGSLRWWNYGGHHRSRNRQSGCCGGLGIR